MGNFGDRQRGNQLTVNRENLVSADSCERPTVCRGHEHLTRYDTSLKAPRLSSKGPPGLLHRHRREPFRGPGSSRDAYQVRDPTLISLAGLRT